jgi:NAD-dependent SIR2 family protein deacetylase
MDNEMLLLGAGASVEAGVPDAKRMAKEIIKKSTMIPVLKKRQKF